MSNVYYLRPPRSAQEKPRASANEPVALRVALTRTQLAAILMRGSAPRSGQAGRDVTALAVAFHHPQSRSVAVSRHQSSGRPVSTSTAAAKPDVQGLLAVGNAFSPADVMAGKPRFERAGGASALGKTLQRMESEFIAVPDEILVARQGRTGAVAFSIDGWQQLGELVSGLVSSHRMMIENWARRGSQPGIQIKYRATYPFGRIVHPGASEATHLRALAAGFSLQAYGADRAVVIEFSLAAR